MSRAEEIQAELRVLELEEQLAEAKSTDDGPSRDLKADLREARRVHRTLREGGDPAAGEARPVTIEASAGVA